MFYYIIKRAHNVCEICKVDNKEELTIRTNFRVYVLNV